MRFGLSLMTPSQMPVSGWKGLVLSAIQSTKAASKYGASTCKIGACERKSVTAGLCASHYLRKRKYGDPLAGPHIRPRRDNYEDGQTCSVEHCEKRPRSHGLCDGHAKKLKKYGDPLGGAPERAPRGAGKRFLKKCCKADTDECIEWPYGQDASGYGRHGQVAASRAVCEMAHGRSVGDANHAAHSCGNRLCVNPRHLRWATAAENAADKVLHGRASVNLQPEQVLEIYRRAHCGEPLTALAAKFGIKYENARRIKTGEIWSSVTRGAA